MVENLITLYDANETEFMTSGLGNLNDAVSCSVTEEINGEFELKMTYPITGPLYDKLTHNNIIFCQPDPFRRAQPFRIYEVVKSIGNAVEVSARHISYDLIWYPIRPFTIDADPYPMLVSHPYIILARNVMYILSDEMSKEYNKLRHPFSFFLDGYVDAYVSEGLVEGEPASISEEAWKNRIKKVKLSTPKNIRDFLLGEGAFLTAFPGEFEFDRWDIVLHERRGAVTDFVIEYGVNMLTLQYGNSFEDPWTGILAYYADKDSKITYYSHNSGVCYGVDSDGNPISQEEAFTKFGYEKILTMDMTQLVDEANGGSEPEDPDILGILLRVVTERYVDVNRFKPVESIDVSFYDIPSEDEKRKLQSARLGDFVSLLYPNFNLSISLEITSVTFDVLTNRYSSVQLGSPVRGLIDLYLNRISSLAASTSGNYLVTETVGYYGLGKEMIGSGISVTIPLPRNFYINNSSYNTSMDPGYSVTFERPKFSPSPSTSVIPEPAVHIEIENYGYENFTVRMYDDDPCFTWVAKLIL